MLEHAGIAQKFRAYMCVTTLVQSLIIYKQSRSSVAQCSGALMVTWECQLRQQTGRGGALSLRDVVSPH